MSWNNIIPWNIFKPLCKICKHRYSSHREDVGCLGVFDEEEDPKSFWKGTCKSDCKKYCETNLDYLEYKYEQHNKQ